MYRTAVAVLGAIALAGCMQITPEGWAPVETPSLTQRLNGQYDVFGACAFERLRPESMHFRVDDLRGANTMRIYYQYSNLWVEVRPYEIMIRQTQPGMFEVVFRTGSERVAQEFWGKMASCPTNPPAATVPASPTPNRR